MHQTPPFSAMFDSSGYETSISLQRTAVGVCITMTTTSSPGLWNAHPALGTQCGLLSGCKYSHVSETHPWYPAEITIVNRDPGCSGYIWVAKEFFWQEVACWFIECFETRPRPWIWQFCLSVFFSGLPPQCRWSETIWKTVTFDSCLYHDPYIEMPENLGCSLNVQCLSGFQGHHPHWKGKVTQEAS